MRTDQIIFFVVFALVVGGIFTFMALKQMQENKSREANFKRAELERRAKQAIWAGATIATVRPHTSTEGMPENVRVNLTLQVQPPNGEPYTARTTWRVKYALLSQFQPGSSLSVKIDKDDPDLIFPNQLGVEYWKE